MKNSPAITACALFGAVLPTAAEVSTNSLPVSTAIQQSPAGQNWNWHVQNTDIVQGYSGFPAKYSGPNSLPNGGETRETVSLDLMAGVRLWRGAEAHIDGMMYQGFGVNNALGVDGFPNGEAFRLGWSDGNNQAWVFSDVDYTATAGISVKGEVWQRPDDTFGLAGVFNGISKVHQEFLAAGGTGILAGDGNLNYGWEKILETY